MLFRASTAPEIFNMFFWNIIIVSAYHFIIFAICVKLPQSSFDENKSRYQMKKFERNGKFYKQTLKINVWKEHVPQFTGKDGFSKEHMSNNVSVEYLNEFIAETCRAEWTHETQGLSIIFTFLANPPGYSLFFTFFVLLINMPCTAIQRYNHFRLQTLRKRLIRTGSMLPSMASA